MSKTPKLPHELPKKLKVTTANFRFHLKNAWLVVTGKSRMQKVRYIVWTIVGLYALAVFAFLLFFWIGPYIQSLKQVTVKYFRDLVPEVVQDVDARLLDGIQVATSSVNPPLVGVMIENHVESRPLSGLSSARVVYEAPVEGNITRFFVIYPLEEMPEKVGPVRSVRPYYLKWAMEFGKPLFVHVGGSPDALKKIKSDDYNDFDEYFNGQFFWRNGRARPHNVYTNQELITESGSATSTEFVGWKFEPASTSSTDWGEPTQEGSEFSLAYSKPWHEVSWVYDQDDDLYYRIQAGRLQRDENGDKIGASTVIVQRAHGEVIDNIGRLEIDVYGEGEAHVFKHGQHVSSTWKSAQDEMRTRFFDEEGVEVELAPGKIWVQVVNQWHDVVIGDEGDE
jgi:hypothetical protein